jgi:uncharacterized protein with von Willebrand factor type A (vWA) domain
VFFNLLTGLKKAGLPVSVGEYLSLIGAVKAGVAATSVEDFYYLSRASLVKDERHLDRFDRVFGTVFKGLEGDAALEAVFAQIPAEWLKSLSELVLSEEDKAKIEALGGWEKLMDTLRQRMEEQKGAHRGGNKWIGTGGTSPFGADGFNPEGVRIGQKESRNKRAVKVWDKREYANLDDTLELGTRNIKMALRRLRRFARQGAPTELDIDGTIQATAHQGGLLDLHMVPERHNAVKVLLLLDIGGSMDEHVRTCAELFSAVRTEFKHLETFYFHNCIYESVWRDNRRRHAERTPTDKLLNSYGPDYKVVIVGDAAMSPYEIMQKGGSVEHWNDEEGAVWIKRILATWRRAVWINPIPRNNWGYTQSIALIRDIMEQRMYPLTLVGLDEAMSELTH